MRLTAAAVKRSRERCEPPICIGRRLGYLLPVGSRAQTGLTRAAPLPPQPVLVYDGACEFCTSLAGRWERKAGGRLECLPLQDASVSARFPNLARDRLARGVHLIEPSGRVSSGAAAVFRAPGGGRLRRWLLQLHERSPVFAGAAQAGYQLVARNRRAVARLVRWFGQRRA